MEQISGIGMDTSKHVFQLHRVNAAEVVVLRKKLRDKETAEQGDSGILREACTNGGRDRHGPTNLAGSVTPHDDRGTPIPIRRPALPSGTDGPARAPLAHTGSTPPAATNPHLAWPLRVVRPPRNDPPLPAPPVVAGMVRGAACGSSPNPPDVSNSGPHLL